MARSWDRRVAGDFYIFRFLKKYTVLIGSGDPAPVYGVLGLVSPIEEVVPKPAADAGAHDPYCLSRDV